MNKFIAIALITFINFSSLSTAETIAVDGWVDESNNHFVESVKVHDDTPETYDEYELMEIAYEILSFIYETANDEEYDVGFISTGHFTDGPNRYYSRTRKGLVLEMYYSSPSVLHTPWGKWQLGSSHSTYGEFERLMDEVLIPKLGLELLKEGKQTSWGYHGPYYDITSWDGQTLPKAQYDFQNLDLDSYETMKKKWCAFAREHGLDSYRCRLP